MSQFPALSFDAFATRYCERQEQTAEGLLAILQRQRELYSPDGWALLECVQLDSSRCGELVIIPFGGSASNASAPVRPVSPRGLASDTSVTVAVLPVSNLPDAAS